MSGFELNKIAGAVILAGIIALLAGKLADTVYQPDDSENNDNIIIASEANPTKAKEIVPEIDIATLLASADLAFGEKATKKKCSACHTFGSGEGHKSGPNLWGILGSDIAGKSDYKYSKAMSAKGGKWDYDALAAFLKKPKKYIKGTKMSFIGLKKDKEKASVVLYLRSLNDNPASLPDVKVKVSPEEVTSEESLGKISPSAGGIDIKNIDADIRELLEGELTSEK